MHFRMTVVTFVPALSGLDVHPNLLDMRECAGKCLRGEDALQLVAPRHMQADSSRRESSVAQASGLEGASHVKVCSRLSTLLDSTGSVERQYRARGFRASRSSQPNLSVYQFAVGYIGRDAGGCNRAPEWWALLFFWTPKPPVDALACMTEHAQAKPRPTVKTSSAPAPPTLGRRLVAHVGGRAQSPALVLARGSPSGQDPRLQAAHSRPEYVQHRRLSW